MHSQSNRTWKESILIPPWRKVFQWENTSLLSRRDKAKQIRKFNCSTGKMTEGRTPKNVCHSTKQQPCLKYFLIHSSTHSMRISDYCQFQNIVAWTLWSRKHLLYCFLEWKNIQLKRFVSLFFLNSGLWFCKYCQIGTSLKNYFTPQRGLVS